MSRKAGIVDDTIVRRKAANSALTQEEITALMAAYTADKTCILEEDALIFLRWAQHCKLISQTFELVLEGHVRIVVEGEVVKVGLRR